MAKNRVRVKGNKKGRQRWAKGHSGASNPSRTKFRDAAKNKSLKGQGFGKQKSPTVNSSTANTIHASDDLLNNSGRDIPSKLTAECLLRHEAVLGQIDSSSGGTTGTIFGSGRLAQFYFWGVKKLLIYLNMIYFTV